MSLEAQIATFAYLRSLTGGEGLFGSTLRLHLHESGLDPVREKVLDEFLAGIDGGGPTPWLLIEAHRIPQPAGVNAIVAALCEFQGDLGRAGEFYAREGRLPDAVMARERALRAFARTDNHERLAELERDERFQDAWIPSVKSEIAAWQGRPFETMWQSALSIAGSPPGVLWIVLIGAGAWVALLAGVSLGHKNSLSTLGILAMGFLLGLFSAGFALFAAVWTEKSLGIKLGGGFWRDTIFWFAVGWREELVKLAFFALLLPVVVMRRSQMEAGLAAACVGLGFATLENIGYLSSLQLHNALGRFFSANLLHIMCTGLLGLTLADVFLKPREGDKLLGRIAAIAMLHGVYDLVLSRDELVFLQTWGVIWVAGVVIAFCRSLRLETEGAPLLPGRGSFVLLCFLTAAMAVLAGSAWTLGLDHAPWILLQIALALAAFGAVTFVELTEEEEA